MIASNLFQGQPTTNETSNVSGATTIECNNKVALYESRLIASESERRYWKVWAFVIAGTWAASWVMGKK